MSRSIEIDAPISAVFSRLTDLNEYTKWNQFPKGDPTNQTSVTGDGLISFLVWKGDKTGEGVVHWITNAKSDSKTGDLNL